QIRSTKKIEDVSQWFTPSHERLLRDTTPPGPSVVDDHRVDDQAHVTLSIENGVSAGSSQPAMSTTSLVEMDPTTAEVGSSDRTHCASSTAQGEEDMSISPPVSRHSSPSPSCHLSASPPPPSHDSSPPPPTPHLSPSSPPPNPHL